MLKIAPTRLLTDTLGTRWSVDLVDKGNRLSSVMVMVLIETTREGERREVATILGRMEAKNPSGITIRTENMADAMMIEAKVGDLGFVVELI